MEGNRRDVGSYRNSNSVNMKNPKIRNFEKTADEKSKNIFDYLCKVNEEQKNVNLDFIRKILGTNKGKFEYNESVFRTITNYDLIESIKNNKVQKEKQNYDEVLSGDEFTNLLTRKAVKNLLFSDDSLDVKRFSTEEYGRVNNN